MRIATSTRKATLLTLAAALVLLAAACGGGEPSGDQATPAGTGEPTAAEPTAAEPTAAEPTTEEAEPTEAETTEAALEPTDPLTVAVFFTNAAFAHVYLAESEGYFAEEGVDVTLQNDTGSNTLSVVVSGQADLGMIGAGAPLLAAQEGQPTSIIFAHIGNANGGVVVARPEFDSLDALSRVGATGLGSSAYGFCNFYSESLDLGWEIVPLQDIQALRGAVASGQVDGACNSYLNFRELIDAGDVEVLVDSRDPAVREEYIGTDFPEAAVFGLTENLEAKREAVTRFMRAVGRAQEFLDTQDAQAIAESLHGLPVFENLTVDQLVTQVEDTVPHYAPNDGYITEEVWEFAVTQYEAWGLGIDASSETFSYEQRVDMSYFEEAIGDPA